MASRRLSREHPEGKPKTTADAMRKLSAARSESPQMAEQLGKPSERQDQFT